MDFLAIYSETGMIGICGALLVYMIVSMQKRMGDQQSALKELEIENRGQSETLENMEGMKKEAQFVKNLGFTGKGSIHPKQISILNEIFTPSEEEISKAKRIMDQFKKANTGLVVIDGKLIERPVLREMQRKLLVANKINKS